MPTRLAQYLLVASVVVTAVTCYGLSLFEPDTGEVGQPFTVFCDTSRKGLDFPSGHNIVSNLRISRDQGRGNGDQYVTSLQSPTRKKSGSSHSEIPPGRDWSIGYSGNNIIIPLPGDNITASGDNWDTMRLSVKVYDTELDDSGHYTCRVEYLTYINDRYELKVEEYSSQFMVIEANAEEEEEDDTDMMESHQMMD